MEQAKTSKALHSNKRSVLKETILGFMEYSSSKHKPSQRLNSQRKDRARVQSLYIDSMTDIRSTKDLFVGKAGNSIVGDLETKMIIFN
jgi:hypothetical protein